MSNIVFFCNTYYRDDLVRPKTACWEVSIDMADTQS